MHISSRSSGMPTWHENCVIIIPDRGEVIKYEKSGGEGERFRGESEEEEAEESWG